MAGSLTAHDCCGQAEHLMFTVSGPTSLSSHGLSPNASTKTILQILRRLPQMKLVAVRKFLKGFDMPRLQTLALVLRSFSDIRFDIFLEVIDYAPVPRILKYLEICAIPRTALTKKEKEPVEISRPSTAVSVVHAPQPPSTTVIIRRMRATPLEITHVIAHQFLKNLFMPGFLFPDQLPLENGCFQFEGSFYQDSNPHALLALNKGLLPTYLRLLWAGNVWVVGPGHQKDTLKFIDRLPDIWMRIKRMRLTFTTEDICGATELIPNMINSVTDAGGNLTLNNIELLERFAGHCDSVSKELVSIWWAKVFVITFLALDDFTLDLRDAHGPDDVFWPRGDWI